MTRPPEPQHITYRSVSNPDVPVVIHPQDDGSLIIDVDQALRGRARTKAIMAVLGPYLRGELTLTPIALLAAGWEACKRWAGRHQRASSAITATAVTVAIGMAALADDGRPDLLAAPLPTAVTLTAVQTITSISTTPPQSPTGRVHETSQPPGGNHRTTGRPAKPPATHAPPDRSQPPQPARRSSSPSRPTSPAARPSRSSRSAPHTTRPPSRTAEETTRMLPPTAEAAEAGKEERGRAGTGGNEQAAPPTVRQQDDQPPTPQPEPGPTALSGGDDCDRLIHVGVGRLLDVCLP